MSHPLKLLNSMDLPCRGIVHVGASTGQEVPDYIDAGLDIAILIEPIPPCYEELRKAIEGQSNMVAAQAVCAAKAGVTYDFHIASNIGMSSSILAPADHLDEHPEVTFPQIVKVVSSTLDHVVDQVRQRTELPVDRIDTLVLDVQGAELLVLQGGSATLAQAKYVFSEVSYGNLYADDVTLEDYQQHLLEAGFRLFWLGMNRHGWGDALFVRPEVLKSQ